MNRDDLFERIWEVYNRLPRQGESWKGKAVIGKDLSSENKGPKTIETEFKRLHKRLDEMEEKQ